MPTDVADYVSSVANAYRSLQEWCAPRILVDGTEGYSAVARCSNSMADTLFLSANFVHLLRNPRTCLGEYLHVVGTDDLANMEQRWTESTRRLLAEMTNAQNLQLRWEDLIADNGYKSTRALCSHLSIPLLPDSSVETSGSNPPQKTNSYNGQLQSDTCSAAWRLGYKLTEENKDFLFIEPDARHGAVVWLQKGDLSKPALVLLHGILGTSVGAQLQTYLPDDMPVITL